MENLRIEIFIPKTEPSPCLKSFYDMLVNEFGGFTVLNGSSSKNIHGYWLNPKNGILEHDNIMLILIYAKRDKAETHAILDHELNRIGQLLNQQCMMYAINNEKFLVKVKPRGCFTDITYKYCPECGGERYHMNNECVNCKRNQKLNSVKRGKQ